MAENYVVWFDKLRMTDVETVGGKNASLGEMISQLASSGVRVPGGFATTAQAYRDFLAHNGLADRINAMLAKLDVDDVVELARVGKEIRQLIVDTPFPAQLEAEIRTAYDRWSPTPAPPSRWPCALPPPQKTCRTLRSPVSKKPS